MIVTPKKIEKNNTTNINIDEFNWFYLYGGLHYQLSN